MEPAPSRRDVVLGPLKVWAPIVLLAAASLGYAFLPGAPAKLAAALIVAALQIALVLTLFMRLGRASGLVRFTAVVAVVWLSFLFLMSFADILTR